MDEKEYLTLMDRFAMSPLTLLEIQEEGFRIRMEKPGVAEAATEAQRTGAAAAGNAVGVPKVNAANAANMLAANAGNAPGMPMANAANTSGTLSAAASGFAPAQAGDAAERGAADHSQVAGQDVTQVKAPLVGIFYSAPSPDAAPFVEPGSKVQKGQTLCLLEAMKMMNELTSPVDGVVRAVYGVNGQMAEYGEVLFEVVPC